MTTIKTLSEINFDITLKVAKVRGGYAIISGYNKLSKTFKTEALAQAELEEKNLIMNTGQKVLVLHM
ncbi:hypothetical protein [Capnocytophaga leadbetteri]|uniref:hypothetical protein n=1 Tax=Capnocytophaga leadbetteri TaxID=327575 RepID=UPI0028E64B90|nr:hypothetical protein [Capnocytophaga leadbetteri]